MILVGILLVSGFALVLVESPGYSRGGFGSAFWKLPLDEKLDHVSGHRREWWWISIWSLVGLFFMSGGVFGLAALLAGAGQAVLASVATGGYVVSLTAWIFGATLQAATVSRAARQRSETGATPSWIHPFWDAGYVAEGVWVVGSNLAYAVFGVAILASGVVAPWAGWVAAVGGALTAVLVVTTRAGFPQLAILIPAVLGVAVLVAAF